MVQNTLMTHAMQINPAADAQPPATFQTLSDLLGVGSSRKFIFIFIAFGALLLALAMRFGFPGRDSVASVALGAMAVKNAVSVHTGPPPSFMPDDADPVAAVVPKPHVASPNPPVAVSEAPVDAEPPIEELAPLEGGGPNVVMDATVPLDEVAFPMPTNQIPAIVPSGNLQEVEVLC
jgi:hypothetical protein